MCVFLVRLSSGFIPFPPPFFFCSLCPTVTNIADLMLRVKFHLAWPVVGLSADLLLFRWKPEHNIKWEIPFTPCHPPTQQLCKISLFKEVYFCILEIPLHATKIATLNKEILPLPLTLLVPRNIPFYSQPFKFRQVTKSLQLQTFQVVEMQVPVAQKSHTDCNLRDRSIHQCPPAGHTQGRCWEARTHVSVSSFHVQTQLPTWLFCSYRLIF